MSISGTSNESGGFWMKVLFMSKQYNSWKHMHSLPNDFQLKGVKSFLVLNDGTSHPYTHVLKLWRPVKARCFQKVQFPWFGPISFSDIINFVRKVSLWRRRRNWSKQRELKLLEASRWTRFPRKISPWRPKSPRPKNQHIIFYFVLLEKKGNSWIWHEELYFF